jgi:hypothetical protein
MRSTSLFAAALAALNAAGCASVSTRVVELDPTLRLPPSQRVEILFEKPQRPFRQIALIESRGIPDGEAELLEQARSKAQAMGADAIVRLEVEKTQRPPIVIHDPPYSPFHFGSWFDRFMYWRPPLADEYRVFGAVTIFTLKALAIQYE